MNLLDLIFPRRCVSCGDFGNYLCEKDSQKITYRQKHFCPVCEKNSISGYTHTRCQKKYGLDGLICLLDYAGPVRKLVTLIKYRFVKESIEILLEKSSQSPTFPKELFAG